MEFGLFLNIIGLNRINPPVIILIVIYVSRAILGSVERMIAVLTESYGGKWPFWLSPRQVMVVPVGIPFNQYASDVASQLKKLGFCAEADTDDSNTMNKKVRNAQIAQYNFIFGENILFTSFFRTSYFAIIKKTLNYL